MSNMDTFHTTADNSWGLEPLIDVGELATYLGIPVSTICPVCHGKRLKPEAPIESLVAGPRSPPRRMCDPQQCVPRRRSVLLRSSSPRGCGSDFVHWSIWGWATFH